MTHDFLHGQIKDMSDNQAKVAAKTAAAANARAVYKQECVMYENKCKRQDKKDARLLDMY